MPVACKGIYCVYFPRCSTSFRGGGGGGGWLSTCPVDPGSTTALSATAGLLTRRSLCCPAHQAARQPADSRWIPWTGSWLSPDSQLVQFLIEWYWQMNILMHRWGPVCRLPGSLVCPCLKIHEAIVVNIQMSRIQVLLSSYLKLVVGSKPARTSTT